MQEVVKYKFILDFSKLKMSIILRKLKNLKEWLEYKLPISVRRNGIINNKEKKARRKK